MKKGEGMGKVKGMKMGEGMRKCEGMSKGEWIEGRLRG